MANVDSIEWSPDGSNLDESDLDNRAAIRVVGLDGTDHPVVAQDPGPFAEAAEQVRVAAGWQRAGLPRLVEQPAVLRPYRRPRETAVGRSMATARRQYDDYARPALSPDGKTIAYPVLRRRAHPCRRRRRPGSIDPLAFDGDIGLGSRPSWSPDGTRIAFQRSVGLDGPVGVGPAAGGPSSKRARDAERCRGIAAEFSPDGSELVVLYLSDHTTWILDAAGGSREKAYHVR